MSDHGDSEENMSINNADVSVANQVNGSFTGICHSEAYLRCADVTLIDILTAGVKFH